MTAPLVTTEHAQVLRSLLIGQRTEGGLQGLPKDTSVPDGPARTPVPPTVGPSLTDFHAVLVMAPGSERDAMALGLWDAGMLVTTFKSPHEAEGVLVGEAVHVVLLDAALGAAMAPQVVWWLNAVGRGAVKVVVFGDLTDAQRASMLAQGVAYCVPRPGNTNVFARQLGEVMGFTPTGWR